jgi:hypothetical protein
VKTEEKGNEITAIPTSFGETDEGIRYRNYRCGGLTSEGCQYQIANQVMKKRGITFFFAGESGNTVRGRERVL